MTIKDIVTFIITDSSLSTNDGTNAIIRAIKERQKLNRANSTAIAKATLQLGDIVSVSGISPKYLNGMQGKIVSFNKTRSRADIEITNNRNDYRVKVGVLQNGYPVQCLTVVTPNFTVKGSTYDSSVLDFLEA